MPRPAASRTNAQPSGRAFFFSNEKTKECAQAQTEQKKGRFFRNNPSVRLTRLELVLLAEHAPQTCAYADSATTARTLDIILANTQFVNGFFEFC